MGASALPRATPRYQSYARAEPTRPPTSRPAYDDNDDDDVYPSDDGDRDRAGYARRQDGPQKRQRAGGHPDDDWGSDLGTGSVIPPAVSVSSRAWTDASALRSTAVSPARPVSPPSAPRASAHFSSVAGVGGSGSGGGGTGGGGGSATFEYRIRFDGGSRGNPGVSGAGFVICPYSSREPTAADILHGEYHFMGERGTNNEAEYLGCITALENARRNGYDGVVVEGDSKLVIKYGIDMARWLPTAGHVL